MVTFGVTYYPDLWPEEQWAGNFEQIRESGFDVVRFGEMSWNWVEPKEGQFDFKGLDRAMQIAHQNELQVLLGIGTAQAPTWLIRKYPLVRPVAHDGTLYPEYGPRPNACRDNADYRELAERYATKVTDRYAKHPALWAWQVDNEPVYPPLDVASFKDYCHCKATTLAFQKFAKQKYGSIEKANAAWGAAFWTVSFSSFLDVVPPKVGTWDAGNPHLFLDWYEFKSAQLGGWVRDLKRIVKKIDPKHPVGTNGFIGIAPRVPDHNVLAEELDWYGWDIYPAGGGNTPMEIDFMADWWRSICEHRGAQFHVTELQGGRNVRWGDTRYVDGPEIKTWVHQCVAHGAKVILLHAWRTPLFGNESGGFGILDQSGRRTPRLDAIEEAIREVKAIETKLGFPPSEENFEPERARTEGSEGKNLASFSSPGKSERFRAGGNPAESPIAIAYLRRSDVFTFQDQGPPREVVGQWMPVRTDIGFMYALNSLKGAYKIASSATSPVQIISEIELESSPLPYSVLLLPNPYLLSRIAFEKLQNFINDGGILVTEARFGLRDEKGFLTDPPLLEKLLPLRYLYTETLSGKTPISSLLAYGTLFRDVVEVNEGVVARFDDGNPALIEKKIGKGKILYGTFSLFASAMLEENKRLVKTICNSVISITTVTNT